MNIITPFSAKINIFCVGFPDWTVFSGVFAGNHHGRRDGWPPAGRAVPEKRAHERGGRKNSAEPEEGVSLNFFLNWLIFIWHTSFYYAIMYVVMTLNHLFFSSFPPAAASGGSRRAGNEPRKREKEREG